MLRTDNVLVLIMTTMIRDDSDDSDCKSVPYKGLAWSLYILDTFISSEIAASDTPKYENNLVLVERPRNQAIEV